MGNTHIETGVSKRHKKLQSFNLYVLLSLRMSFKPKKLTAHNPHLFSFFRDMLRRQRRLRWNLKAVFVWAKQLQGGAFFQLNSQAHWNCKYLTIWRTICWNLASVTAEEQHDRTFFVRIFPLPVLSARSVCVGHDNKSHGYSIGVVSTYRRRSPKSCKRKRKRFTMSK